MEGGVFCRLANENDYSAVLVGECDFAGEVSFFWDFATDVSATVERDPRLEECAVGGCGWSRTRQKKKFMCPACFFSLLVSCPLASHPQKSVFG